LSNVSVSDVELIDSQLISNITVHEENPNHSAILHEITCDISTLCSSIDHDKNHNSLIKDILGIK
jgi:hypothetical protein